MATMVWWLAWEAVDISRIRLLYFAVGFCYYWRMPTVRCKMCAALFYAKPSWLKHGYGKYCSARCQYEGRKNGKIINCFICGTVTYKPRKVIKRSKSKKYFCSKSCQTKWRNTEFVGLKHANWKSGRYAYRSILKRHKVPAVCVLCRTTDSRVLATHHIDHNRINNTRNNLAWLCHNCHFLVHHYSVEKDAFAETLV